MLSFRQKVNRIKEVAERVNNYLGINQANTDPAKYVLQNTNTGEFFCEFSESLIQTDTRFIQFAAYFEKESDAHLLMAHLEGNYSAVPKEKFLQKEVSQ